MDISGISTSVSQKNFVAAPTRVSGLAPVEQEASVREARHEDAPHTRVRKGRALAVFRQEMRMALRAEFRANFASQHAGYAKMQEPPSAGQVAEEALGAARTVAAESPTTAAKSMITFRAKIQESAYCACRAVGEQDDVSDIEDAVAKVEEGLDSIENEVANNRESSASVLSVESQTRQRSSIRIRTQEGDVVRLSLRSKESISATDVAVSDGQNSLTSTEVDISSKSRMVLKVDGDLNENELAAITNVFAQAEQIANEFFGGDIGAAFNLAQGFEFDTEQLARIKMNFRMSQYTSASYAETRSSIPALESAAPSSDDAQASVDEVVFRRPAIAAQSEPASAAPAEDVPDENVAPVASAPAQESTDVTATETPAIEPFALSGFLESLGDFLRSVTEGFNTSSLEGGFKFHYSESFKLELLSSVFTAVAPEDKAVAANHASLIIDSVASDDAEHEV